MKSRIITAKLCSTQFWKAGFWSHLLSRPSSAKRILERHEIQTSSSFVKIFDLFDGKYFFTETFLSFCWASFYKFEEQYVTTILYLFASLMKPQCLCFWQMLDSRSDINWYWYPTFLFPLELRNLWSTIMKAINLKRSPNPSQTPSIIQPKLLGLATWPWAWDWDLSLNTLPSRPSM